MPFQPGSLNPTKPQPPRYDVGETKGEFIIREHLGRSDTNPETGRVLCKHQHWYRVECACGNFEVINQGNLLSRDYCLDCVSESRSHKVSVYRNDVAAKVKADSQLEDVPDFATMRW